jgi:hypothetical protein
MGSPLRLLNRSRQVQLAHTAEKMNRRLYLIRSDFSAFYGSMWAVLPTGPVAVSADIDIKPF